MFQEVVLDPLVEEDINVRVFFHLLLPLRALEVLVDLHDILEIVKGKYPAGLVYDKHGQESQSHVDVGGQTDASPRLGDRGVLHDVELILQLHQLVLLLDGEVHFLLELEVRGDGSGVEEDRVVGRETVIGGCEKVGHSVGEQGHFHLGKSDALISGD